MFVELREFLLALTSPEYTDQAMRTCDLLTRAGMHSHEEGFMRLMEYTYVDNAQMLVDVDNTLKDYLDEMLGQFGVTFEETTTLSVLNNAFEALLSLPNYGDPESVLSLLQSDQTEEEIFAELLGLASDGVSSEFITQIESLDAALLKVIETTTNELMGGEPGDQDISPIRDRLRFYVRRYPGLLVDKAIRDGATLGTEFSELIEPYQDDVVVLMKDPTALAKELVGFMLATEVPMTELRETLLDELEDVVESINVLTRVTIEINPFIAEVQEHVKA